VVERLDDALRDTGVGAVVVASPSDLHEEQSVAAARAGRHVLLEKPVALTPEASTGCSSRSRTPAFLCQVDMILRWHPMVEAIVAARDRGDLGDLFCVEGDLCSGSSRAPSRTGHAGRRRVQRPPHAGCHPYDQLAWLMGSPIVEVASVSTRRSPRWATTSPRSPRALRNVASGERRRRSRRASPYRFGIRVFGPPEPS